MNAFLGLFCKLCHSWELLVGSRFESFKNYLFYMPDKICPQSLPLCTSKGNKISRKNDQRKVLQTPKIYLSKFSLINAFMSF